MIHIVAAIAANGVIGKGGKIPWHISEDLKRFKALTMGGVLVMGRKTYESIGRPLPGRRNVVCSRSGFAAPGVEPLGGDLKTFLRMHNLGQLLTKELFVIGGAEVYREALPYADRLHLTRVHADFDGDVSFPEWDRSAFVLVGTEEVKEEGALTASFETWERKVVV